MSNESTSVESNCTEEGGSNADGVRVFLVAGIGPTLCCVGIVSNTFLLLVFSKLPFTRNHLLYIVCLSCFDIIVEICYVLIFTVSMLCDYYHLYLLYCMWHGYVRLVSLIAQVIIPASVYIIIAASAERYMSSKEAKMNHFSPQQRIAVICLMLLLTTVTKGTVFFEISVSYNEECEGFAKYHLLRSPITKSWAYSTIWMFWVRNIFNVFLPFTLLFFLNWATVRNMSTECEEQLLSEKETAGKFSQNRFANQRRKKRDASRMLVCLVSVYLVTNTPNFLITIWEHIHVESLIGFADGLMYTYASDISSLLTTGCTAFRICIYYSCNREIRHELRAFTYSLPFIRYRHKINHS